MRMTSRREKGRKKLEKALMRLMDKKQINKYAEHEQCAHCINPQYCQGKEDCYDFAKAKDYFLAGAEQFLKEGL